MYKIILDTNILFSYLYSKNKDTAIHKAVELIGDPNYSILYSDDIYEEYIEVLFREKNNFDVYEVSYLLTAIKEFGTKVSSNKSSIQMIDETDRKFYDIYDTMRSNNTYIITGNTKHFPKEKNIVTAKEFIDRINNKGD